MAGKMKQNQGERKKKVVGSRVGERGILMGTRIDIVRAETAHKLGGTPSTKKRLRKSKEWLLYGQEKKDQG